LIGHWDDIGGLASQMRRPPDTFRANSTWIWAKTLQIRRKA
jgi:hypothetical protein